eukprot:1043800-Rhodomonas_salina.2
MRSSKPPLPPHCERDNKVSCLLLLPLLSHLLHTVFLPRFLPSLASVLLKWALEGEARGEKISQQEAKKGRADDTLQQPRCSQGVSIAGSGERCGGAGVRHGRGRRRRTDDGERGGGGKKREEEVSQGEARRVRKDKEG